MTAERFRRKYFFARRTSLSLVKSVRREYNIRKSRLVRADSRRDVYRKTLYER